jgi:hypothetical protein
MPDPIPNDREVYRGMCNSNWAKHGIVTYRAFLLRPAGKFPAETELSLGRSPESAVDELIEHHGAAELHVGAIHALPHNLVVAADPESPAKAYMFGLPLHSTQQAQVDLAMTMATDLAGIATWVPVPAPPVQ